MKIDIQASDFPFPLSDNLRGYIASSLNISLIKKGEYIERVLVRLSHVNNPCSWADKCCSIQVELANQPDLLIENTETDLYAAINRATNRTKRAMEQRLLVQSNNERVYTLHNAVSTVE